MRKIWAFWSMTVLLLGGFIFAADSTGVSTTQPTMVNSKVSLEQHLLNVSVTLRSESASTRAEGSGIIKTRIRNLGKPNEEVINFVWTAAHVVKNLRKSEKIDDPDTGTQRSIISFNPARIIQESKEGGRRVGESRMDVRVIRYSESEDLALLEILKRGFIVDSVKFWHSMKNQKSPPPNTRLLHVGSMGGQELGANSLTFGRIASIGRILDNKPFDQTNVTASPGSSGGGMFLEYNKPEINGHKGECVGILTMGVRSGGDNFNFIVPMWRIENWAKKAGILWALYDNEKLPSQDALDHMAKVPEHIDRSFSSGPQGTSHSCLSFSLKKDHYYLVREYKYQERLINQKTRDFFDKEKGNAETPKK